MTAACVSLLAAGPAVDAGAPACPRPATRQQPTLPVFLQFYDWFHENSWKEEAFVDPIDWARLGITDSDRSSTAFYLKQFRYIRNLGVDALSWQFNTRLGRPRSYPPPEAVQGLAAAGLTVAPFLDLELSLKVRNHQEIKATFTNEGAIHPTDETASYIVAELSDFFAHVPKRLLARDRKGRLVVFVFGFGFDERNEDPKAWAAFAKGLVASMTRLLGEAPTFYWTFRNARFAEHLFLHDREHFVPFQFVLDNPQAQFGHDSVSWNFGFDNLGAAKRDHLQRVLRVDPRYIREMGWLAGAVDPALVYVYGWNEVFEASMLIPTRAWGETKGRMAADYIARLRRERNPLPSALLVVDDLDAQVTTRQDDWHLTMLRQALWYSLRRYLPQADVRLASEVNRCVLEQYELVVDATSQKDPALSTLLVAELDRRRVMIFTSLPNSSELVQPFVEGPTKYLSLNASAPLSGGGTLFIRDDVLRVTACRSCSVLQRATLPPSAGGGETPVVVERGDDVWVNSYGWNEAVLAVAFSSLYGRPMGQTILYGEGFASQRLEIEPDGKVTRNHSIHGSVNQLWPMPEGMSWFRTPPEVRPEDVRFILGLEPN